MTAGVDVGNDANGDAGYDAGAGTASSAGAGVGSHAVPVLVPALTPILVLVLAAGRGFRECGGVWSTSFCLWVGHTLVITALLFGLHVHVTVRH